MEDWNYAQSADDEDMSLSSENSADLLPSIQKLACQFQMDPIESKDRFEAAMMSQDENDDNNVETEKWEDTNSESSRRGDEKCEKDYGKKEELSSTEDESQPPILLGYDDDAIQSSLPDEGEEANFHEKDICDSQFDEKASLSSLGYDNENEDEEEEVSSSSEGSKTITSEDQNGDTQQRFSFENPVETEIGGNPEQNEMFEDAQNLVNEDRSTLFTTRLEGIIKELGRVREELGKVRENCRLESELLSEALEKALNYNKSLRDTTAAALGRYITPPSSPTNNTLTTSLLENKLRISRQNASAAYRAQLDQLEALVDREMNTLQDNMIRLEPLNRIATDWENRVQPEPSLVYRHDYTVEVAVASSQVSVKSPDP